MSISDRLDQIEQRGVRAASLSTEDWTTPECLFLVENELPELVEAVRRRDAALRAVLDLHAEIWHDGPRCNECSEPELDEPAEYPCPAARAVEAALGEEV